VLLVEGGPTLNGELFERGMVDEFFLTLGAVVVGGQRMLTPVEGKRAPSQETVTRLEVLTAVPNPETQEVYMHDRVRRD
jgi:riboflavin biosynthesis pyrimidine reductase